MNSIQTQDREKLIGEFLAKSPDFSEFDFKKIAGDASFRSYYRIQNGNKNYILMDAPPEYEDMKPFVNVSNILLQNNLSAPQIHEIDYDNGFMVLEDFGQDKYSNLLLDNQKLQNLEISEEGLYRNAIDALIHLHDKGRNSSNCELKYYNESELLREVNLLIDWYLPYVLKITPSEEQRKDFEQIWLEIFNKLKTGTEQYLQNSVIILRDYHADNLMWLKEKQGVARVGMLDFQDALIGSPAYDVASLLEDARRDVDGKFADKMLGYFLDNSKSNLDANQLVKEYSILTLQRNIKIIGIFARLCYRDGKKHYLDYIPRVLEYIKRDLNREFALFKNLAEWLKLTGIDWI